VKAGVVIPLPQEAKAFTRQQLKLAEPHVLSEHIVIIQAGVGSELARLAAKILMQHKIELLISFGTCAALRETVTLGELIIPKQVYTYTGEKFDTYTPMRACLLELLQLYVSQKTLTELPHLVKSPVEKREIAQDTNCEVGDMESGALARFAKKQDLPYLVVRAVSDTVAMRVPEAVVHAVDPYGKVNIPLYLKHMILHPKDIGATWKLARGLNKAQQAMTVAAKQLFTCLAQH